MKKVLSRILAVAIAIVLFSAPIATQAATSTPVLVINIEGVKYFTYQPSSLLLKGNEATLLEDTSTSDGWWFVPAGYKATFRYDLDAGSGYHQVRVFRSYPGSSQMSMIYDSGITNERFPYIEIPSLSYDATYRIAVVALSDISISSYAQYLDK